MLYPVISAFRMSDKGKGKAKPTFRKRKRSQLSSKSVTVGYSVIHLFDKDKVDRLLPPANSEKFPNLYCELQFPLFQQRHLNLEKKLDIPSDLRQFTEPQIRDRGWAFLDKELARVNESWVHEFYCNFFRPTLDSVYLRGRQILVTEVDIEEALRC
ncbi:hypothetical protein AHAS_Ahas15G0196800 [Arachis hypogaea]